MVNNVEKAKELLLKYKQNHIIDFMNSLNEEEKQILAMQVLHIDFEELKELYKKTEEEIYTDLEEILPITAINPDKLDEVKKQEYINLGEKIIKENKFAVATMAGGQGTRLRPQQTKRYIQNRYWRKWKIFIRNYCRYFNKS